MSWKPYKTNILIEPQDKNKVIGDTQTKYLYGKVLAVGSEVKDIKVGDTLGYTMWGTNKIVMADGKEHYFLQDNSEFILGILSND
jgi:co-chaperonin GroES (HSP10)